MISSDEAYEGLRTVAARRLLSEYSRAVLHLRQMKGWNRFGLVFGAGIGKDFKFPDWKELLNLIAAHPDVDATSIAGRDETATAQLLFEKFRSEYATKHKKEGTAPRTRLEVQAGWRQVLRDCLYREVPETIEDLRSKDKYLFELCRLVKATPLTVTYNFDDTLERIIASLRTESERDRRGYTTVWSGNVQLHAKRGGVIYHPNGFLPRELRDRPSNALVFSEDAFADQLIDSMAGHYATLFTHFSQTTCLLVGLSLADQTLRHFLRQHAKSFPGHFHYLIRYIREGEAISPALAELEAATNFDVYNLITLYLNAEEIKALTLMLLSEEVDFVSAAEEICGRDGLAYRYFVTGPVSVGKSSAVSYFRSLLTQDEWTEGREPGMEKDPKDLIPEEEIRIDEWVASQIAKKNNNLLASSATGLHMIDRAPLDLFAFAKGTEQWQTKAKRVRTAVEANRAKRTLAPGHVVLLTGDPEVMSGRAASLHKTHSKESLELQQSLLKDTYKLLQPEGSLSIVNTRLKSIDDVVKEIARIVFRNKYVAADMDACLRQIETSGYQKAKDD